MWPAIAVSDMCGLWTERDFNWKELGFRDWECPSLLPCALLSLLLRAVPPAWPQPHGHRASPHSGARGYCPSVHLRKVSMAFGCSPWRADLFLSTRCLPALSELQWPSAWWRGTFYEVQELCAKLLQCDSIQDLVQHFTHSAWTHDQAAFCWLLLKGRGEEGKNILVLEGLLLHQLQKEYIFHIQKGC